MSKIDAAMVAITKRIAEQGIGKTRKNAQQGYNFRGVDEVMNAFAPVLAAEGVFVRPRFTNRILLERQTQKGSALFYVTVEGSFTFRADDGSECEVGPFFGEAMDTADKATNKAMAVAFKYAMFQTFCVPLEGVTGGDADQTTHEVVPIKVTPTSGAWEALDPEEQAYLTDVAQDVSKLLADKGADEAMAYLEKQTLTAEEKIALWTRLDSKQRTALKKAGKQAA